MRSARSFQSWSDILSLSLPLSGQFIVIWFFLLQLNFKSSVIYLIFPLLISSSSVAVPSPSILLNTIRVLSDIFGLWLVVWVGSVTNSFWLGNLDQSFFFLALAACESWMVIQYRLTLRHYFCGKAWRWRQSEGGYLKLVLHSSLK